MGESDWNSSRVRFLYHISLSKTKLAKHCKFALTLNIVTICTLEYRSLLKDKQYNYQFKGKK